MPIHYKVNLESVSDSAFNEIDAVVMRCAYASQNYFGRLFDERIYENDMAARLRAEGLTVYTQVPIRVSHYGFEKFYHLDLVVDQMIYELKVVEKLVGAHIAQALNYAMLQDVRLVKIINFGEGRVRGKLLRNALRRQDRNLSTMGSVAWKPLGANCENLLEHIKNLLGDWGTHLESRLYNEALVYYFGGEATCLKRMELLSSNTVLGTHLIQQHDPLHGFVVTAFSKPSESYRRHLKILLRHIPELEGIQWINLNHCRLDLNTIEARSEEQIAVEELLAF